MIVNLLQQIVHSNISVFFFNDTATTEIYTLSLHDALPISKAPGISPELELTGSWGSYNSFNLGGQFSTGLLWKHLDRKSTRLNSSHANISYAVFCLKKKTNLRH